MEARGPDSIIQIEDGVWMNNNVCIVSDGPGVFIGKRSMLGTHCEIIDSDFHDLHPDRRTNGVGKSAKVEIGENVLIGSNVKILKGVKIGIGGQDDLVVGTGESNLKDGCTFKISIDLPGSPGLGNA